MEKSDTEVLAQTLLDCLDEGGKHLPLVKWIEVLEMINLGINSRLSAAYEDRA